MCVLMCNVIIILIMCNINEMKIMCEMVIVM